MPKLIDGQQPKGEGGLKIGESARAIAKPPVRYSMTGKCTATWQ
jgi:hypothetical protein